MRKFQVILLILIYQTSFGQIKYGTYSTVDSPHYVSCQIYQNGTFNFKDIRDENYLPIYDYYAHWKVIKDTIIFSWSYFLEEDVDSMIHNKMGNSPNITITFLYNDGEPISDVQTCYVCPSLSDCKMYYSDINGKVVIPKTLFEDSNMYNCSNELRRLTYIIKNQYADISSSTAQDSLYYDFTIIVKKKRKTRFIKGTKKYLIKDNILIDIYPQTGILLNWGNLKFSN